MIAKKKSKQLQDELMGSAHRVWLAGLGAMAMAEQESNKLFKALVERGETVEVRGKETVEKAKGTVTDAGMARLREFLSEVPAELFKTPLKAADVPRLFTTETFCKVVIRAQRAATA